MKQLIYRSYISYQRLTHFIAIITQYDLKLGEEGTKFFSQPFNFVNLLNNKLKWWIITIQFLTICSDYSTILLHILVKIQI